MRSRFNVPKALTVLGFSLTSLMLMGFGGQSCRGLDRQAKHELAEAGVNKYLGEFEPISSEDVGDGWNRHAFDTEDGHGPTCISGTQFSTFTRAGDPTKLLILLQGGGACWQDFYRCNILSEAQEPPPLPFGIWDFDSPDNPFADYSVVYMPYCDGSVFGGDNDVDDPAWEAYLESEEVGVPRELAQPIRYHRGLRNLSAGMDVAKATFPHATKVTVAGSSAGGVGAAAFAPFLARFLYGNYVKLTVFNDAGPIAVNLDATAAVAARDNDWQFAQFYPQSCIDDGLCNASGQQTGIVQWRLDNDSSIREAFYETDADGTNIGFASANVPGFPPIVPFDPANGVFGLTQVPYRELVLAEHGALNDAHPDRYKRFIVSGDDSHTALQGPLFYSQTVDGVVLNEWTADFLTRGPLWLDLVEDFVPLPPPSP